MYINNIDLTLNFRHVITKQGNISYQQDSKVSDPRPKIGMGHFCCLGFEGLNLGD